MTPEQALSAYIGGLSDAFKDVTDHAACRAIWRIFHKLSIAANEQATKLKYDEMDRMITNNGNMITEIQDGLAIL